MKKRIFKYQHLALQILERIISEKYHDNDYFDSEYNLSSEFKVDRGTVRRALAELLNADILYKQSTYGIFVKSVFNGELLLKRFKQEGSSIFSPSKKNAKRDMICFFSRFSFDDTFHLANQGGWYEQMIGQSIMNYSDLHNCDFLVLHAGNPEQLLEQENLAKIRKHGLLWLEPRDDEIILRLREYGCNVVNIVSGGQNPEFNYVYSDAKADGKTAANLLIEFGHRRIFFATIYNDNKCNTLRFEGAREACVEHGLGADAVVLLPNKGKSMKETINLSELIKAENPPTAFLLSTEDGALTVINEAKQLGLLIPEDISLICFDDSYRMAFQEVPVTSMRQPIKEIFFSAIDRLRELKSGIETESVADMSFCSELLIRKSVGYAPELRGHVSTSGKKSMSEVI
ncbi:MAG: substrate-binding domain-containing protein [Planctomycetota bacterium]|jgi:DNA-binding LacI/PurR family transcriptional regulator/DNA-binding transcriptional regulator YhcF (GntR family)